jgi:cyclic beta-1,2-glucan synthetase
LVAQRLSRTPQPTEKPLLPEQRRELRVIARRTWSFFETFVGDADHWLPPDNFQEVPEGKVAHRTSPTNIGLLALSTLSAHDLGYLGLGSLLERLEKTFDTLDRLERYHGHFYNWYDTVSLETLRPAYVSTVDSGNLAASLVALKQGLLEKLRVPWPGDALVEGVTDTVEVVLRALSATLDVSERTLPLRHRAESLARLVPHACLDLPEWRTWLVRLCRHSDGLIREMASWQADSKSEELGVWTARLAALVHDALTELDALAPWLKLLDDTEAEKHSAALAGHPETAPQWEALHRRLTGEDSVADLAAKQENVAKELEALGKRATEAEAWLRAVAAAVRCGTAPTLLSRCRRLAERADQVAGAMDFSFLYRPDRHLFAIGYTPATGKLDNASYDLLASEARLTSFLAVARGQAPRKHWFHLSRLVTRAEGELCLISWGGTMFEYLMPELILPCYADTLLDESRRAAVERQIAYGRQRGVPWGISESGFASQNSSLDYQYQAFGVPGLGLKRGLSGDLVVAPYATALAATVRPHDALVNFRHLAEEGCAGAHGYYEAIDYTRDRLPPGRRSLVVRSYMAHHQGMSLVALTNCLLDNRMQRRFHAETAVRAADLLLQERVPFTVLPEEPVREETAPPAHPPLTDGAVSRRLITTDTPAPRTHLLSNGRYTVLVTNAGGGYGRCRGLAVSRWREDLTRDHWGSFVYLRDLDSRTVWSAAHQPVRKATDAYEVVFSADKAEFRRLDDGILTHLEITVPPERDVEVRRLTLTNQTEEPRHIDITSYVELVLLPQAADVAHPAFGKLFVETEWDAAHLALLARRRPRSAEQNPVWAVHVLAAEDDQEVSVETDRARFLGRGRTPADPASLEAEVLSGTTGPVLDPVFSIRKRILLPPEESVTLAFTTGLAETREEALALADHYRDLQCVLRAFELAWAHSQVELRHLQLPGGEAHLYQRLAAHLIFAGPVLRAEDALATNRLDRSGLWRFGISGDLPILLVLVDAKENLPIVRQLLSAHAYWHLKGLETDLVLVNERPTGYQEELRTELDHAIRTSDSHAYVEQRGGVFLRQTDQLGEEGRRLLKAAARVVLRADRRTLAERLQEIDNPPVLPTELTLPRRREPPEPVRPLPPEPALLSDNGSGGFTPDGREYVIRVCEAAEGGRVCFRPPPAPWCNVVANPQFGFLVSESGGGCTWADNSQTNRLTPWHNDPVSDPPSEIVYLRDEMTGSVWTPTPLPLGTALPTRVRHGQGYTVFEQRSSGLATRLTLFVPPDDPVKVIALNVRNEGAQPRRLSTAFFAEWVLGGVRELASGVVTEVDADSGALFARNAFQSDHGGQVAFADVSLRPRTLSGCRTEFLGRNGSTSAPAALRRVGLSGRAGAALDPCAALHALFDLRPDEEKRIVFVLGAAADAPAARRLAVRYRDPDRVEEVLKQVQSGWDAVVGAVQVRTPDPGLDVLVNRWLPYQVLSCRVRGRSGLYQSSGAYGFRDQLQDVMALVYGARAEARAHLLRAAGRQFVEGDVQHWWHPPSGRGVRSHCSDDYLWLPFAVCHYVSVTGDASVLDERVPFLQGPQVPPQREDDYGLPERAAQDGSLYEHCVRAVEHGLRFGPHGLPLMGTGDWNDGMNRVGAGGKGESVWLAWFLIACLRSCADLAAQRGDSARADRWRAEAERLRSAIEDTAWDGDWYLRAWFDEGTPLGSRSDDECRIDSIAQTWAVLSGAGQAERAERALAAVREQLVRQDSGLILLFTPPFDRGPLHPGYIKGYLPGIRENGGQYTHAACWVLQAAALLGHSDRAGELLDMLNPVRRTATPATTALYRVEPYVVAGDIYGEAPHTGRGGWTWYTGAAGWLYRVVLETLLGFRLRGESFTLEPCPPSAWNGFDLSYRHGSSTYRIHIENPDRKQRGVAEVVLDGQPVPSGQVPLSADGKDHEVRVVLR